MAEESDLERTEPASSRRLEQAREEGRVPQSREMASFMVLLSGVGGFWVMGGGLMQHASNILRRGLHFGQDSAFDAWAMQVTAGALLYEAFFFLAPVFFLSIVGALASPLMLGGLNFAPKAMSFDIDRINPIKGIGRIFSVQGATELIKAVFKALLVGVVVYWVVMHQHGALFALMNQPIESSLVSFGQILLFSALALMGGVALIAAMDVPFQLWQYYSKLRMTREELRQESKEQDGDPHVKARIRSQQREMARRRMMADVPGADVVITNPTHFAVALKYDKEKMGAPQVVAKGMNLVAQSIRDLAVQHGVPQLEAPPLARALYRHTDIGEQIPVTLYTAVAEVMAYVYQLSQHMSDRDRYAMPSPILDRLSIPDGMDPGAERAMPA